MTNIPMTLIDIQQVIKDLIAAGMREEEAISMANVLASTLQETHVVQSDPKEK